MNLSFLTSGQGAPGHAAGMVTVLLVPVVLRWVFGARRDPPAPAPRLVEAGIALACGLALAAASTWYLAPFYLPGPVDAPDFYEYCAAVMFLDGEHGAPFPPNRAFLPGVVPALLRESVGLVDGLAVWSLVSTVLCGAALYGWGRLFAGRSGGLFVVAVAATMAPLVAMPRMLSFYPALAAGFVWAGFAASAAVLSPTVPRLVAAGVGVGLCLLLDVRGVLWGGTWLLAALGAALLAPRGRRLPGIAAVMAPVALAWVAGEWCYPRDAASLESQMDVRPLFAAHGARGPTFAPPFTYLSAWVPGRTPLLQVPRTLGFLLDQAALARETRVRLPNPMGAWEAHILPWVLAMGMTLPLLLLLLRKKPRALVALAIGVAPFLFVLHSVGHIMEAFPRFFVHALPGVAVLLGVALGLVFRHVPGRSRWRLPSWVRAPALLAVLVLVISGCVPSWLSPFALWRRPLQVSNRDLHEVLDPDGIPRVPTANEAQSRQYHCARAVWEGFERNGPLPLRAYGQDLAWHR